MSADYITVTSSSDEDIPNLGLDNGVVVPTLASVTHIIAANIPSLAGISSAIRDSAPSAPSSIDSIANSNTTHMPSLAGTASSEASAAAASTHTWSTPAPGANTGAAGIDSISSSLANIPSLAMITTDGPPTSYIDEPYTPPLPTMEMAGDSVAGTLISLIY